MYFKRTNSKIKFVVHVLLLSISLNYCFSSNVKFYKKNETLSSKFKEIIRKTLPVLQQVTTVCVVSKYDVLLDILLETSYSRFLTILVLDETFRVPLDICSNVIILDLDEDENWKTVIGQIKNKPVYLISNQNHTKVASLEKQLEKLTSVEIRVIFFLDGSEYELSSAFQTPRYFAKSSIQEFLQHKKKQNKINFNGQKLTVASRNIIPYFYTNDFLKQLLNTKKKNYLNSKQKEQHAITHVQPEETEGIEDFMMKEIACQLNFSIKYELHKHFGLRLPNGTFANGIAKAMFDGTADLGIGGVFQIGLLFPVLDFGPSLGEYKIVFLVRRPTQVNIYFGILIKSFELQVWLFILIGFALVNIVYWTSTLVPRKNNRFNHKTSMCETVMILFGHYIMSASNDPERTTVSRIILTSWSVFSLLVTTAVSSGIVSKFTLPHYSPRVDSVRQMVEGNYYWTDPYYGELRATAKVREVVFNLNNSWMVLIEQKYKYLKPEEIRERAKFDEKMTITAHIYRKNIVMVNNIGILQSGLLYKYRLTKEAIKESHVTWGIRKNSPLFDSVTYLMNQIMAAGLIDYWRGEVLRKLSKFKTIDLLVERDTLTFSEAQPLRMTHFQAEFYLLLAGLAISLLVFVLEHFVKVS